MFDKPLTRDARIAGAAALLADVRRGRRDKPAGLPEGLQPADVAEAEEMQVATYAALGWRIAGWKVGRAGPHIFAAPMPDVAVAPLGSATLRLPSGSGMELEAALRLRGDLDAAALAGLTPAALPGLADLVLLFEWVESRYAASHAQRDLEKIADVVANGSVSYGPATGAWSWADVETLEMRLTVDGIEVARHAGAHKSMPIAPLIEAWRDRCQRIGHLPRAGEVITLGSLTGLLPVPAAGGLIRGECTGRGALEARVAPLGAG